ncbi:MAG: hypothetical protein JWO49_1760 [Arthrobacter sp.]|nr:hypothetical protein [Arthrobacter sp.]
MPVAVFEIEKYSVSHGRTTTAQIARITLHGPVTASGSRDSAQLLFSPSSSGLSGVVDNVGVASAGIQIFADLPYGDFAPMYDLVRSEAPVHLWCEYGSSSTTTKPLDYAGIVSGSSETPGEGPADADSVQ